MILAAVGVLVSPARTATRPIATNVAEFKPSTCGRERRDASETLTFSNPIED
jgi:hypothetical protein